MLAGRNSALSQSMLESFEVEPSAPQRGTVIWMHGLGASNHDFDDILPELDTPYLRYVFPAAPIRRVTVAGGMPMPAWYDVLSLDAPPLRESEPHVRESQAAITALIQRETDRGLPSERIALAGFSQGGAMALHVGLRHPETLAGVMVLSGYLLLPHTLDMERSPANAHTSVLLAHGTHDDVVPLALARQATKALRAASYPVENHEYPMGHSMCTPEVTDIARWLKARFT